MSEPVEKLYVVRVITDDMKPMVVYSGHDYNEAHRIYEAHVANYRMVQFCEGLFTVIDQCRWPSYSVRGDAASRVVPLRKEG